MLTYKKYKTMRNRTYIVAGIIAMIILVFSIRTVIGDTKRETISCTIRNKQVQTRMTGAGGDITTEYRYLVKTDKELFVIENSLINGAYNNSELFMSLDTGKQYTITKLKHSYSNTQYRYCQLYKPARRKTQYR
jgi:hypothetical protein